MDTWLNTSSLKEDEKSCKACGCPFSGKETLHIKDDKNVVVKYIECSHCMAKLILNAKRSN